MVSTPLKDMSSSVGIMIPNIWKMKFMFQTTNQLFSSFLVFYIHHIPILHDSIMIFPIFSDIPPVILRFSPLNISISRGISHDIPHVSRSGHLLARCICWPRPRRSRILCLIVPEIRHGIKLLHFE